MSDYYTLLTKIGLAKLTNAHASGSVVQWANMAVGDGNGAAVTPTETQTALVHETYRASINRLAVDDINPNYLIAELVIPATTGGFTIREIGIFDTDGNLVAAANCPANYKPVLSEGSATDLVVRVIVMLSNTDSVQLKIDPSVVLATRKYVDDSITTALNKQDGKQSARLATTATIALAGLQVIDGVQLTSGDRVLVKAQAAGKDNGIYIAAAGAWSRAADADANIEVTPGLFVTVEQGSANADSLWQLTTDGAITLGTTALAFEMVAGKTGVAAGTYKSITVDARGRVIGGTNPTTLQEAGLTDGATQKGIQQSAYNSAIATGSADVITATFSPAITAASNGMTVQVRALTANTSTTPTFTPASGTVPAKAIVKAAGTALVAGDIIAGHWMEMTFDSALDKWILLNPITGSVTVTAATDASYADNSAKPASTGWVRAALAAIATAAGFVYSISNNGYIKFPTWLASFMVAWGQTNTTYTANVTTPVSWTFPLAFTTNVGAVFAIPGNNVSSFRTCEGWSLTSADGFILHTSSITMKTMWLAFGR